MTPPKDVPYIIRPENLTNAHRHSERGVRVMTPRELGGGTILGAREGIE